MLRAAIWRDLRWRMLLAAVPVLVPAALVALSYAARAHGDGGTANGYVGYVGYLDAAWFWLPGASAVFLLAAVIVSSAGSLLRPRGDVAYLLALPVSRTRWLLAHAGMSLAALAGLIVLADAVLAAGAVPSRAPVALVPLLARSLAVWVAAGAWVCVTLGVLSVVRVPPLAALLVLIAAAGSADHFELTIPARPSPPPLLPAWDPWALADPRGWAHGVPIESLLSAAALALAGLLLALHRLHRHEP